MQPKKLMHRIEFDHDIDMWAYTKAGQAARLADLKALQAEAPEEPDEDADAIEETEELSEELQDEQEADPCPEVFEGSSGEGDEGADEEKPPAIDAEVLLQILPPVGNCCCLLQLFSHNHNLVRGLIVGLCR